MRVAATTAPRPGLGLDGAGPGLDGGAGLVRPGSVAGGAASGCGVDLSGSRVGRIWDRTSELAVGPVIQNRNVKKNNKEEKVLHILNSFRTISYFFYYSIRS